MSELVVLAWVKGRDVKGFPQNLKESHLGTKTSHSSPIFSDILSEQKTITNSGFHYSLKKGKAPIRNKWDCLVKLMEQNGISHLKVEGWILTHTCVFLFPTGMQALSCSICSKIDFLSICCLYGKASTAKLCSSTESFLTADGNVAQAAENHFYAA